MPIDVAQHAGLRRTQRDAVARRVDAVLLEQSDAGRLGRPRSLRLAARRSRTSTLRTRGRRRSTSARWSTARPTTSAPATSRTGAGPTSSTSRAPDRRPRALRHLPEHARTPTGSFGAPVAGRGAQQREPTTHVRRSARTVSRSSSNPTACRPPASRTLGGDPRDRSRSRGGRRWSLATVNSGFQDRQAALSDDAETLYFASNQAGGRPRRHLDEHARGDRPLIIMSDGRICNPRWGC